MSDYLTHPAVYSAEANARHNRMLWLKSLIASLAIPLTACASPNSDTDTSVVAAPDAAPSPPVATAEPFPTVSPDMDQPNGSDSSDTDPEISGAGDTDTSSEILPLEKLYQWRETATAPECGPGYGESAVSVEENADGSLKVSIQIGNPDSIGSGNNVIAAIQSTITDGVRFASTWLVQLNGGVATVNIPAEQASELKSDPGNHMSTTFNTVPDVITPEWLIDKLPEVIDEKGIPKYGADKESGVVYGIEGVPGMYMFIYWADSGEAPTFDEKNPFRTIKCSDIRWDGQEPVEYITTPEALAEHNPELNL